MCECVQGGFILSVVKTVTSLLHLSLPDAVHTTPSRLTHAEYLELMSAPCTYCINTVVLESVFVFTLWYMEYMNPTLTSMIGSMILVKSRGIVAATRVSCTPDMTSGCWLSPLCIWRQMENVLNWFISPLKGVSVDKTFRIQGDFALPFPSLPGILTGENTEEDVIRYQTLSLFVAFYEPQGLWR